MRTVLISILFTFLALFGLSSCATSDSNINAEQPANTAVPEAPPVAEPISALAEGIKLLETGETDRAIEVLLEAVRLDPDLAEAYFQLGIAYALVEKRDAAVVEAEVTPTPDRKQKNPKENKSESEKAFEKAVAAYKKSIASDPENDAAHFNLGRAYNKLNEDEDAAKSLKQAVKIKPDDTEYQTELGAILIKLAQYHEAIAPLKKALELDPENIRAEELLVDAQAGRKRVDYSAPKKDDKKGDKSANTATDVVESEPGGKFQAARHKFSKARLPGKPDKLIVLTPIKYDYADSEKLSIQFVRQFVLFRGFGS